MSEYEWHDEHEQLIVQTTPDEQVAVCVPPNGILPTEAGQLARALLAAAQSLTAQLGAALAAFALLGALASELLDSLA